MSSSSLSHDQLIIRPEKAEDVDGVRHVNEAAFGRSIEADLIAALRQRKAFVLSLVALLDGQVVGHILFTAAVIEAEQARETCVALGPMAVLPRYQGQGIGSQLVTEGLRRCTQAGHSVLVVLGHPGYYPRFGFKPASQYGIRCEFDLPEEVFMVMALRPGALTGVRGIVKYRPEFAHV